MRWLALVAPIAIAIACGGSGGAVMEVPPPAGGDARLLEEDTATRLFAAARARLGQPAAPAAATGEVTISPGHLVLCAYGDWPGARCAHGSGLSSAAAVDTAAARLVQRYGAALATPRVRLKLDLVTGVRAGAVGESVPIEDAGLVGVWVDGAFLAPSELIERDLLSSRSARWRHQAAAAALSERAGAPVTLDAGTRAILFRTSAWVEAADLSRAPVALYRAHTRARPEPTPALLLERAAWAGSYLARATNARGEIRYHYEVGRASEHDDYNLLRHAGSVWALLGAYERTGEPSLRTAATRALGHLLSVTEVGERRGPFGGGRARFVVSPRSTGPLLKLGGSGLALLAIDQYLRTAYLDPSWTEAEAAEWRQIGDELATFLVSTQQKSGEMTSFLPYKPGDWVPTEPSMYYPGEAALGLVRWYETTGEATWLATSRRAADWLIGVRDRGKSPAELATDHWLMMALSHLYRHGREQRYLDHSLALARSVLPNYERGVEVSKRYPDYRGGFYDPPRSTPAATRSEGLIGVLDTCTMAGIDCTWIDGVLLDSIGHQLLVQYTPDLLYWVPEPDLVAGGWAGGILDTSIRNDYVQHALSAILGFERLLQARTGVVVPGGPTWHGSPAQRAWRALPHAARAQLALPAHWR
ncbi:MAG TPA: beta-L-arabinofuranosidase domain-containing protein [Kofleriaceae bacterium]|nr:beta-L-arabinofuranosidase domain-containing protein [Kofleriaceae bacterium]